MTHKSPGNVCHLLTRLKWIERLHRQNSCTKPLHEFLDFIESKMLRPAPKERSNCKEIGVEIGNLLEKCQTDDIYATEGEAGSRNPGRFEPLYGRRHSVSSIPCFILQRLCLC